MSTIAIVYHSGYGHTKKQAEAIQSGAFAQGVASPLIAIDAEGNLGPAAWETLDQADAIAFGSPTYMGSVSWQFKKFADASSKAWGRQAWKDKLAAAFTNSATINGDKHSTLQYLFTLAMQHGMVWVGTAMLPSNSKAAGRNDVNWLGAFAGAMAQSPSDASPDEGPLPGDLETARRFGARLAQAVLRWQRDERDRTAAPEATLAL